MQHKQNNYKISFVKKSTSILVLFFFSTFLHSNAQEGYNKMSVDLNYGLSIPIKPETINRSKYISFSHVNAGFRYMWNEKWGVKLSYTHDEFENGTKGLVIHQLGAEGVLNVVKVLGYRNPAKRFGLLAHAGLGLSLGKPKPNNASDFMGNIDLGLIPQVRLSKRIAINGDITYTANVKQSYDMKGELLSSATGINGGMLNVSIGLSIYLGAEEYHADWY